MLIPLMDVSCAETTHANAPTATEQASNKPKKGLSTETPPPK
jgi:hypothetical protein